MPECPFCHHYELAGALFCRHCGYPLWEEVARTEALTRPRSAPSATGAQSTTVRLRLPTGRILTLPGAGPWLIGRRTRTSAPDIDAQEWGARHVSRQHARLEWRRDGLYLVDLGSTNGTWVNGYRLSPHEPKRLQDGDLVRWADWEVQVLLRPSKAASPV